VSREIGGSTTYLTKTGITLLKAAPIMNPTAISYDIAFNGKLP
jgi:hypothetical protein